MMRNRAKRRRYENTTGVTYDTSHTRPGSDKTSLVDIRPELGESQLGVK